MDPFLGEIRMVGFNYAPQGWATCDGQLLSIAQNSALFALLGVQFGGNGTTNFALPDLRGRAAIHQGQGTGLSPRTMGQVIGEENVTLTTNQIPSHSHTVTAAATTSEASTADPAGAILGTTGLPSFADPATANTTLGGLSSGSAGNGQSHDNMSPSQVVNFIIATQGIFPSRP